MPGLRGGNRKEHKVTQLSHRLGFWKACQIGVVTGLPGLTPRLQLFGHSLQCDPGQCVHRLASDFRFHHHQRHAGPGQQVAGVDGQTADVNDEGALHGLQCKRHHRHKRRAVVTNGSQRRDAPGVQQHAQSLGQSGIMGHVCCLSLMCLATCSISPWQASSTRSRTCSNPFSPPWYGSGTTGLSWIRQNSVRRRTLR